MLFSSPNNDHLLTRYLEYWVAKYKLDEAKQPFYLEESTGSLAPRHNQAGLLGVKEIADLFIIRGHAAPVIPKWNFCLFRGTDRMSPYFRGSGVLIDVGGNQRQYALTTAHQWEIKDAGAYNYYALCGTNWVNDIGDRSFVYPIRLVENFSCPKKSTRQTDLALIEIQNFTQANAGISILSTADFGRLFQNKKKDCGVIFGWGKANRDLGGEAPMLRCTVMEFDKFISSDQSYFTCLSFDERGPAGGDSGGPMVVVKDDEPFLAGVVKGNNAFEDGFYHTNADPCKFISIPMVVDRILDSIKSDDGADHGDCQ